MLSTDACDYGYGAVLEQMIDGINYPIAYFSKSYTPTQRKYSTSEKELLAVVMSIEYFHQYLYGKFFLVYVDHQPLTWILHKTNTHPRLERWLLRLSHYNFEIIYKAGKDNIVADMLSKLPDENEYADPENDYLDNLVAVAEEEDSSMYSNFDNKKQLSIQWIKNDQIENEVDFDLILPLSCLYYLPLLLVLLLVFLIKSILCFC